MMKKLLQIMLTVIFSLCLVCGTVATASAASVGKVKNLKAVTAPTSVTLKWTAPSDAKGYKVEQYIKKKWKTVKTIDKAKTTSVKITGLKAKTTYKFRVAAKGKKSYGEFVSVSAKTVPPTVTGVKVTPELQTASVKWTKAEGVKGYEVEYSTSKKFSGKTTKTVKIKKGSTVKASLNKLSPGKTYYLRVRSYATYKDKTYYGSYSKTVSFKTAYKAQVSKLKASEVTYNSVKITWNKVSDVSGYQVEKKSGKKWVSLNKEVSKKSTSYTVKELSPVTKITLRVRPYKKVDGKIYAGEWDDVSATTTIGPVKKLAYKSLTTTSVKLTWSEAKGAKGYYIMNNGKKIDTVKTNSATLKIKAGTAYKITVVAYNGSVKSAASSAITFTSPCEKVGGLKASPTETSLKFSWSKVTGAKSYQVQYCKKNGSWSSAKSTTSTSYTINSLEPNTAYQFRVRAVNKNGSDTQYGAYSSTVYSTTYGVTAAVTSSSKMTLSWGAVSGAAKYALQKYDPSSSSWKTVKTVTGTSYSVSSSEAAYYRVVAKSSSDKTLFTTSCYVLKTSGVTIKQSGYNVTVSWSKVSGATEYQVRRSTSADWTDIDKYSKSTYKAEYFLSPNFVHTFRVFAITSSGEKKLCELKVVTPNFNPDDTSDVSKNAQIHYLAEAVNRSKYDNSRDVRIDITGRATQEITYVAMVGSAAPLFSAFLVGSGYDSKEFFKTGNLVWDSPKEIDAFINYMNSNAGEGEDRAERKTETEYSRRYTKKAGDVIGTLSNTGGTVAEVDAFMESVFEPAASGKYTAEIYKGTDSAAVAKAFDITTTKTSDGYKIVAKIKQGKTLDYHRGFIAGIVERVEKIKNEAKGLDVEILMTTTVTATIDSNGLLKSYTIESPYETKVGFEEKNMESDDGEKVDIAILTNTKGAYSYNYKFSRG